MAEQLEKGTQFPMRPTIATLDMAADFALADHSGGIDWTNANTALTPRFRERFFHKKNFAHNRITIAGSTILPDPGIWRITFEGLVRNDSVTIEDILFAITNSAGTTLFFVSDQVTCTPNGNHTAFRFTIVHHITETTPNTILRLRAAQMTAGTDLFIESGHIGLVEKVGNFNETT